MTEKQKSMTHRLVLMAMFVAVQIILSRFLSINLWNLKIGFSFIPIVLAGHPAGASERRLGGLVAGCPWGNLISHRRILPRLFADILHHRFWVRVFPA